MHATCVGSPSILATPQQRAVVSPDFQAVPSGSVSRLGRELQVEELETPQPIVRRPWPSDLISLANITIGSLFSRWYMDELYNCTPDRALEKQHFNLCAKVVQYCKYFLPCGSVIGVKPRSASDLMVYRAQLSSWGQMMDVVVHEFAERTVSQLREGTRKRVRSSKPYVSATYKRLTEIDATGDCVKERLMGKHEASLWHVQDNASSLDVV